MAVSPVVLTRSSSQVPGEPTGDETAARAPEPDRPQAHTRGHAAASGLESGGLAIARLFLTLPGPSQPVPGAGWGLAASRLAQKRPEKAESPPWTLPQPISGRVGPEAQSGAGRCPARALGRTDGGAGDPGQEGVVQPAPAGAAPRAAAAAAGAVRPAAQGNAPLARPRACGPASGAAPPAGPPLPGSEARGR